MEKAENPIENEESEFQKTILHSILIVNINYLYSIIQKQCPSICDSLTRVKKLWKFIDAIEATIQRQIIESSKLESFPMFQDEEFTIEFSKIYQFESTEYPELPTEVSNTFLSEFNPIKCEKVNSKTVESIIKNFLETEAEIIKEADLVLFLNDSGLSLLNSVTYDKTGSIKAGTGSKKQKVVPIIQVTEKPVVLGDTKVVSCINLKIDACLSTVTKMLTQLNTAKKSVKKNARSILNSSKIGDITFLTDQMLGSGEFGSKVYKGFFQDRKCAVKCLLLKNYERAKTEMELLLKADSHQNIIRYYGKGIDTKFAYIAIELCQGTLEDFVQLCKANKEDALKNKLYEAFKSIHLDQNKKLEMVKGIISGLEHLHKLNIVHKNLRPKKVMISAEGIPKLADIGDFRGREDSVEDAKASADLENWDAPEATLTKESDVFSLGCILYYLLTDGVHPFADKSGKVSIKENIRAGKYDLSLIKEFDTKYLIEHMICYNPAQRYKIEMCDHYILFWSEEKILNFIALVSSTIISLGIRKEFEKIATNLGLLAHCQDGGWAAKIDKDIVNASLGSGAKYMFFSACDLVRFIRNNFVHYREVKPEIQKMLGDVPHGFLNYFISRFPILPTALYKVAAQFLMKDAQVNAFLTSTT